MNVDRPFSPQRSFTVAPAGGAIGTDPSHFVVEELPAYSPSGSGEHLYLWVEKVGRNTADVARSLARAANIKPRDVGYAGMKDKNARTRQWFSICTKADDAQRWDVGPGAEVLSVARHDNKLRTGHLIGNRFVITLVGVPDGGLEKARHLAAAMTERGLPNFFGPQRFGHAGQNLVKAAQWLRSLGAPAISEGTHDRGKRRKRGGDRFENKLLPSVIQSEIFNRYAHARLQDRDRLLEGEVVRLDKTKKHFVVSDPSEELERYQTRDIHLTGPMIGPKGLQAEGEARALEESIIAEVGLDEQELSALGKHAPGARRDLLLYPENLEVDEPAPGQLRLSFCLAAGAYATQVVREFSGAPFFEPRAEPSTR